MVLTALHPAPPIPITLIRTGRSTSSWNENIRPPPHSPRVTTARRHEEFSVKKLPVLASFTQPFLTSAPHCEARSSLTRRHAVWHAATIPPPSHNWDARRCLEAPRLRRAALGGPEDSALFQPRLASPLRATFRR